MAKKRASGNRTSADRKAKGVAESLGVDYSPAVNAYIVPVKIMHGLLDLLTDLDSRVPDDRRPGGRGGKRTYCCKVPADGPIEDCNQFRAYSNEAALVCLRWAIKQGYSSGKLSRGECGDECP